MKNIIPLILICLIAYCDWGQVESSQLQNINTNVSSLNGNVANLISYIDTEFKPNWQIQRQQIRLNGDWLESIYEGYSPNGVTGENVDHELGNYKAFFNTVSSFGGNTFQMPDETQDFLDYIRSFSAVNYNNSISVNGTANPFLDKGQYFNYSEKVLLKLNQDGINETDSWFHVDVYNDSNQSVKKVYSSFGDRVNELLEVPSNIPGSNTNPNILFTLNLSALNDMFVSFGLWNSNPLQSWMFPIKLIPEEGDYLYDFYTWWNSESFYPKTFRICLKGLICLFAFFYCYNYVVSTWNA